MALVISNPCPRCHLGSMAIGYDMVGRLTYRWCVQCSYREYFDRDNGKVTSILCHSGFQAAQ